MIANQKEFTGGLVLLGLFFAVLVLMFQPMFDGKNSMAYLDSLYNSISKGSAYYIPQVREDMAPVAGSSVKLHLEYDARQQAEQSAALFTQANARVSLAGNTLTVEGALGDILNASLDDADAMYSNDGSALEGKYGVDARRVLFNWWTTLLLMDSDLKSQKLFPEAKAVLNIKKKAVETAYNYFGIQPEQIMDKLGIVTFSLIFYVFYTLWYGFAIMFIFEGWGLKLSH